jgi:hypothetical protein
MSRMSETAEGTLRRKPPRRSAELVKLFHPTASRTGGKQETCYKLTADVEHGQS